MASATHLTSNANQANLTSYDTGSFAAPAGEVVVAACYAFGNTDVTPTLSHAGVSAWTLQGSVSAGSGARTLHVFTGIGDGGSGALTFDFGAEELLSLDWTVFAMDGLDSATDDGVVQAATAAETVTSNPSVTLAAFADAANPTVAVFGMNNATSITAGSGFTLIGDTTAISGKAIASEWQDGADTTADITIDSGDEASMGVALEFDVESAGLTAAVISEGTGTDDENAAISVDSYDAAASSHDLHRSTTQGFTPGAGNLLAADIDPDALYVDDTVSADTQYYYVLVSNNGTATESNELAILTAPARPTALTEVGVTATTIEASFTDQTGGSYPHHALIRQQGSSTWTNDADLGAGTTTHTFSGLTRGITYEWTFQAFDSSDGRESGLPNEQTSTPTETLHAFTVSFPFDPAAVP